VEETNAAARELLLANPPQRALELSQAALEVAVEAAKEDGSLEAAYLAGVDDVLTPAKSWAEGFDKSLGALRSVIVKSKRYQDVTVPDSAIGGPTPDIYQAARSDGAYRAQQMADEHYAEFWEAKAKGQSQEFLDSVIAACRKAAGGDPHLLRRVPTAAQVAEMPASGDTSFSVSLVFADDYFKYPSGSHRPEGTTRAAWRLGYDVNESRTYLVAKWLEQAKHEVAREARRHPIKHRRFAANYAIHRDALEAGA
jgi:hypothetical protein